MEVYSDFIHGNPRKVWNGLKKLIEFFNSTSSSISSFNSSSSTVFKDQYGYLLCTSRDLFKRFGEHYHHL